MNSVFLGTGILLTRPVARIDFGGCGGPKSGPFEPKKWILAPHPLIHSTKTPFLPIFWLKLLADLGGFHCILPGYGPVSNIVFWHWNPYSSCRTFRKNLPQRNKLKLHGDLVLWLLLSECFAVLNVASGCLADAIFSWCIIGKRWHTKLWYKYYRGARPSWPSNSHMCDVIKQNESEVEKYDFLFFFCHFLFGYCLGFSLLKTPQRLGNWFQR